MEGTGLHSSTPSTKRMYMPRQYLDHTTHSWIGQHSVVLHSAFLDSASSQSLEPEPLPLNEEAARKLKHPHNPNADHPDREESVTSVR